MKKMMMIEAPEICAHCPFFYDCCFCMRFDEGIEEGYSRPQWCIEKDVEVEDENNSEVRLQSLGFEPVNSEQREKNNIVHDLQHDADWKEVEDEK